MSKKYGFMCRYKWHGLTHKVLVPSILSVRNGFWINAHLEFTRTGYWWIPPSQLLLVEKLDVS